MLVHFQTADMLAESEGKHIGFRAKPRVTSIINMPVITTLYYCCLYHYEEPENLLGSPVAIRKEFQVQMAVFDASFLVLVLFLCNCLKENI